MRIDGVSALAVLVIASFAIDRIATFVVCLASWLHLLPDAELTADPAARIRATRKERMAYYGVAGVLGIGVVAGYGGVRIFQASGFPAMPWLLDTALTGLIMVAGADRVATVLHLPGGAPTDTAPVRPIEVTGKLILEEPAGRPVSGGRAG